MTFSKALTLSAMTSFVGKLMKNEQEKQLGWIENLAERFVVGSVKCSWRPDTSLVPQGPMEVNSNIVLTTWLVGKGTPSTSLQMIQNISVSLVLKTV